MESSPGCSGGIGKGNFSSGASSGAGHGGKGGTGYFNGMVCSGGTDYGNADLPCELGSGTEGPNQTYGQTVGGGIIGNFASFGHAIITASGHFSVIDNRVNCICFLSTHPLVYLWSIHFILFKLIH